MNDYRQIDKDGYLGVDFFLTLSCNRSCFYCTSWTKEMRNLTVDIEFLKFLLDNLKDYKVRINLLGGETGLIKNLKEVTDVIKSYKVFKLVILSNSLIRKTHPWVLEDKEIFYLEHLTLDFYEDEIKKLGGYDYFKENDFNNYNLIIKTPNFFKYRNNYNLDIDHKNTILKKYNSRSPEFDEKNSTSEIDKKICAVFPKVPVINFETKQIQHCSRKVQESKKFEITSKNIHDMMNFKLFKYEKYCEVCKENFIKYNARKGEMLLKMMENI